MKFLSPVLLLMVFIFPGCSALGDAKDFMEDMGGVEDAVVSQTGHEKTQVIYLNGHILQVILVNPEYNELSDEKKEQEARKIAATAYSALREARGIDEVLVVFHINETKIGVVEFNDRRDSFSFPIAELKDGVEPTASASPTT